MADLPSLENTLVETEQVAVLKGSIANMPTVFNIAINVDGDNDKAGRT